MMGWSGTGRWEEVMVGEDDERISLPKPAVGDELSLLSVRELEERIAAFRGEIARLEDAISQKNSVKSAADALFKF